MTVAAIKAMLKNRIDSTRKRYDDQRRNGEDGLCEQVEITTLRDVLNSIETYEKEDE